MTPGAQYQAAIDLLHSFDGASGPLDRFFADWARSHRFAGSKDRAKIKEIVYAIMRRRAEFAWHMGEETPRALVLAELFFEQNVSLNVVAELFSGRKYCPAPLTLKEIKCFSEIRRKRMDAGRDDDAVPDSLRFSFPEWLVGMLSIPEGSTRHHELAALAGRAPVDLRVNGLKTDRESVLESLKGQGIHAAPGAFSDLGVRLVKDKVSPYVNIRGTQIYKKGWVEIQDEAMQVASLLVGAGPRHQVLDLCAGSGGKSLALAALMRNRGQIIACDTQERRLSQMKERLERAGVRNVQTRVIRELDMSASDDPDFAQETNHFDRVLLDVPCSGSGVWRRQPDAKWALTPKRLDHLIALQRTILSRAAPLVKPGGRLIYVTCSLLNSENGDQISAFLGSHDDFSLLPLDEICRETDRLRGGSLVEEANVEHSGTLLMTPGTTQTDGAYVAVLERRR